MGQGYFGDGRGWAAGGFPEEQNRTIITDLIFGWLIIVPWVLTAFRMPCLVSDSFSLEKTIRQEA